MYMNQARANEYMQACGLEALVAHTPVNVAYLSGFVWWLAPLMREYMVVPGGSSDLAQRSFAMYAPPSRAALVLEPYMVANSVDLEVEVWIAGTAPYANDCEAGGELAKLLRLPHAGQDIVEALVTGLTERGLADGRLGVEFDQLPPSMLTALQERLPRAELRDCTNLLRMVRAVKTNAEIEILARSAEIAEEAAGEAFALAVPGRTLDELVQVFRQHVARNGADIDHFGLSPEGTGIAMNTRLLLREGQHHFADFGCLYRGYYSDSGMTLSVGPPTAKAIELHTAVRESVDAGAAVLQPGVRASSIQATMQATLSARGFGNSYPHGHGLGLEVRDYPILAPANQRRIRDQCVDVSSDLALEAGMVVNLEAPVFTLGAGAAQCERSFVIGSHGSRPLINQERLTPTFARKEAGPRLEAAVQESPI
jgi:Xaa-Pro aminopeptidase